MLKHDNLNENLYLIWFRSGNYKKSKGWEGVMGANWKHGMMHTPRWGEVWSLNMKNKRLLRDDGNRMNERYHKVKGKNVEMDVEES